jgi:hypothetical protein
MPPKRDESKPRFTSKWPIVIGCVLVTAIIPDVAIDFMAHPELKQKKEPLKTVAIVPARIKVYRVAAGGVRELMDAWTTAAEEAVTKAIEKHLREQTSFIPVPFPSQSAPLEAQAGTASASMREEIEETMALYDAVSASIWRHSYVPEDTFAEKQTNFDYSLGPDVRKLAAPANADALVFVSGFDIVPTAGRTAVVLMGALATIAVGAATGAAMPLESGGPGTLIGVALVDGSSGSILWYDVGQHIFDLKNPEKAAMLVEQVFKDFPRKPKEK